MELPAATSLEPVRSGFAVAQKAAKNILVKPQSFIRVLVDLLGTPSPRYYLFNELTLEVRGTAKGSAGS